MKSLTASQVAAVKNTAMALGVPAEWLEAVINFETAGTWDPLIKNPLSSARGLIQFVDSTAKGLGYTNAAALVAAFPTIEEQLKGPVLKYFKPYMPFHSPQEFFLTVFFPKYRKAAADTVILSDDAEKRAAFQKANPGIVTVGDYVTKLQAAFSKFHPTTPQKGLGASVLLLLAAGLVFFLRS